MLTKNTKQLKQRVAEHIAADSIVQGVYWDERTKRGCFIGCLARSDDPGINEAVYGLPIAVQRIAEDIFESLPHAEAKAFFAALPDAVGCDGKDLSKVHWQFLAAELRALPPQTDEIQAVIAPVVAGMDMVATGQKWPGAAHAADAAFSAANASYAATATAAAIAAATAAVAAAASYATAAANAASTAVNAAANAANAAGVRLRQRDLLLQLIKEAPVIDSTPAKGVLRIILNRHVVDLVRAVLAKWGRQ